ncbi:MAG: phosphohistidine phosphatase SixA [Gemmatimonadales bacterium]|nr:phosphohistidine phosphatase SixA [Gemmatimonadales bacterium]
MQLLLVQHGVAVNEEVDPRRPLSDAGRHEVERVARCLAAAAESALRWPIAEIRHSGKPRAEQTALILAKALPRAPRVDQSDQLAPNEDLEPLLKELARRAEENTTLVIVGHLPHLARLAGKLIVGREDRRPINFVNAGIAALSYGGSDGWAVDWMLTPAISPPLSTR